MHIGLKGCPGNQEQQRVAVALITVQWIVVTLIVSMNRVDKV